MRYEDKIEYNAICYRNTYIKIKKQPVLHHLDDSTKSLVEQFIFFLE